MLTRLSHLVGNPWLRGGLLAIVLSFCGYGLYSEWPDVTASLARLHWYTAILSLAAAIAGSGCLMVAWRTLLADLGSPLPLRAAARINFLAQLGKYVPGVVWAFAAQVELGHDYQVPRRRSFASVATSLVITVGTGLAVALITLPFTSPALIRHYWWVLCAVPVIIASLCPPVLGRILDRVLTIVRSQPLERWPSWRGLARAIAWNLVGWLLLGLLVWTLVSDMVGLRGSALLLCVGGYSLAYSAGMLLVVIPSGIGARELILVAALSEQMPHGPAVAVALGSRVVTTLSDLALGAVGLGLGGGRAGSGRTTAASSAYAGTSKSAAGSSS